MNPETPLENIFRLHKNQKQGLKKLGLETVQNLLYFFPGHYETYLPPKKIAEIRKGEKVSIFGILRKPETGKTYRTKKPFAQAVLSDESGKIKVFWFSQPYLAKMFPDNSPVKAEGKISERKGKLYLTNPKIEKVESLPIPILGEVNPDQTFSPVYRETRLISSRWIFFHIQRILKSGVLENIQDPIP